MTCHTVLVPIVFPIFWSYTTTESAKKVTPQLRCFVNFLREIKLNGHSGENKTDFKVIEERSCMSPISFTAVLDPLARVTADRVVE